MKKFYCKVLFNKEDITTTSLNWALSKRGRLIVTDDYFKFGKKEMRFSEIKSSILKKVPSAFFWPNYVFTIVMKDGESHHFGFIYSSYWKRKFPFNVERTDTHLP